MSTRTHPLFWLITGADFTRAIARSRTEINDVARQIRERLSSPASSLNRAVTAGHNHEASEGPLAGQPIENAILGVGTHGVQAVPHPFVYSLPIGAATITPHAKPRENAADACPIAVNGA